VSHPALYGWNWTYTLSSGEITVNNAGAVLDHDPEVAAWTGVWFGTAQLDGVTVPVLGADANAPVEPPLLSGHGLQGQGQMVLGNILVTLRPGADLAAQQQILQRIVPADVGGVVLPVQRQVEIVDYRSMGTAPVILAGALVLGAVSSLLLTLLASVRHRRRDLALLKTLGFTRRQLSATVAWQSTAAVAVGVIVGVQLGTVLGRGLWDLFARQISVVPEPTVPALTVILIVAGALLTALLVALLPGRVAGRTPVAALLRAE
jgi:predicted lysophospholipase L1 biosynthesis ABC-type transport system permease subunit